MVGGLLWGMWVLLWRGPPWPVALVGAAFPAATLLAAAAGILPFRFPLGAWLRLDLWAAFALTVTALVVRSVALTGWAVVTGRVEPGILAIPLQGRSEMGKLLFLWAITVTPGTIALLVEEDAAYVHTLHRPAGISLPGMDFLQRLLGGLWG